MKNGKLVITALVLSVMVLALIILESFDIRPGMAESAVSASGGAADDAGTGDGGQQQGETVPRAPVYEFDLKYTKYLVTAPYEYEAGGETRRFKFDEMVRAAETAYEAAKSGTIAYIDNYKNRNGMAPKNDGRTVDDLGNSRSASAPGYYDSSGSGDFRYIADGTLVSVVSENEKLAEVRIVGETDGQSYFVPEHYVPADDALVSLEKVIVVDRAQQNIAAFERVPELVIEPVSINTDAIDPSEFVNVDLMECAADGMTEGAMPAAFPGGRAEWKIVSYSLATTGKNGKYHQPTPLGYYFAIEKKPKFYYLKDGTNDIEGYAPYAIRFTAGAYVHGVAVPYKYTAEGVRVDPGMQEFSRSIGTVPLSHKCVRNYTSHAKFLYDWYEHGKTVVIVIE